MSSTVTAGETDGAGHASAEWYARPPMLRLGSSRVVASCLLASACLSSIDARADTAERTAVALEYTAAHGCPERSWIVAEVEAHADGFRVADGSPHARLFALRIERQRDQYVGTLGSRSTDGEVARGSEIRGPECADVALGLTVAVALALAPASDRSPPASPGTSALEDEGRPPPARTTLVLVDGPTEPPTTPVKRDDGVEATDSASDGRTLREQRASLPLRLGVGARLEGSRGVAGILGGAAVFGEIAWPARDRWFSPSVRLGARRTLPGAVELTSGRVEVTQSVAFAEFCPTTLVSLEGTFEGSACVHANIGALSARGVGITTSYDETLLWVDYGGLGTMRLWLGRHVAFETALGFGVPITRHRLRVNPDGVVSRAAPLVLNAGAGVVHRF